MALTFRTTYLLGIRRSRNCFRRLHTMNSPNFLQPLRLKSSTDNFSLTNILTSTSLKMRKSFNGMPYTISFLSTTATTTIHTKSQGTSILRISEEIREATEGKRKTPVVALESAILTHGMPYPHNVHTALHLQNIIRDQGAIPATVGVIKGKLTVGLSDEEIQVLGSPYSSKSPVVKVSRRDLPYVLSQKFNGGTTVSGTIIGAVKAGIHIFATGGIGGVHRGAETTFDISADLRELGRSPIAVVSAGVKSILDIGKTLEYLETEGVCVCVLKRNGGESSGEDTKLSNKDGSDSGSCAPASIVESNSLLEEDRIPPGTGSAKFPSFFTAESRFDAPYAIADEIQAAILVHSALQMDLQSGILIAVPIPKEFEASGQKIEGAIQEALEKATRFSIQGRDMTPFLLREINQLTEGESLLANKHLIENNVRVATKIATKLVELARNEKEKPRPDSNLSPNKYGGGKEKKSQTWSSNVTGTNDLPLNPTHNQKRSFSTITEKQKVFPDAPLSPSVNTLNTSLLLSRPFHPMKFNHGKEIYCGHLSRKRETVDFNSGLKLPIESQTPFDANHPECSNMNLRFLKVGYQRNEGSAISKRTSNKGRSGLLKIWTRQLCTLSYQNKHIGRPVVIGGTSLDLILSVQEKDIVADGRTHSAKIETTPGGVGRNMAEALGKLGHNPILISAVGDDLFGREVLRQLQLAGLDSSGVFTSSHNPTAIYSAVLNHKGECIFGLGDMSLHSELTPSTILQKHHHHYHHIRSAPIVVLDGNVPVETMAKVLEICMENNVPVWFEPTEVRKAKKILQVPRDFWGGLSYISPNLFELESIMEEIRGSIEKNGVCTDISNGGTFAYSEDNLLSLDIRLHSMVSQCFTLFTGLRLILFTRGKDGFMVLSRKNGTAEKNYEISSFPPPAVAQDEIVSVSGAGDCLNAGFISGLLQSLPIEKCSSRGTLCAQESLQSARNVPHYFNLLK